MKAKTLFVNKYYTTMHTNTQKQCWVLYHIYIKIIKMYLKIIFTIVKSENTLSNVIDIRHILAAKQKSISCSYFEKREKKTYLNKNMNV